MRRCRQNEWAQPATHHTLHQRTRIRVCMCKCMHKDEWYPNEYLERFAKSVCIYQLCWFLVFSEFLTKKVFLYFTKESLLSFCFSLPLFLVLKIRLPATKRCLHSCFKANFPFKRNTLTHIPGYTHNIVHASGLLHNHFCTTSTHKL